tara:strand:- start:66 stop:221 length:156 start_codon:yes stop_codon:yes gene_type:complete
MANLSFINEKTKEVIYISKSKVYEYNEEWNLPKEIAIAFKNYIEYGKTKNK